MVVGPNLGGHLPVLLALILSAVLLLRSRRVPPGLAAAAVLGTSLLTLGGVLAVSQTRGVPMVELASSAGGGIETVRNWLSGPPVNWRASRSTRVSPC